MRITRFKTPTASEITPEAIYLKRREFMAAGATLGAMGLSPSSWAAPSQLNADGPAAPPWLQNKIAHAKPGKALSEALTPYKDATHYNNFYEFGYDKSDPAAKANTLKPHPWQVEIAGEVAKPGKFNLEDLLAGVDLEERIYRLRCVEAWSMVLPWVGFPLVDLLKRFEPTSKAKYVAFTTLEDKQQMPEQKSALSTIRWPYSEGLRIDEATHPLCILAVGLYGRALPNQNGAPLRLVVPWKYGFKSIKSIVKITLMEQQPKTSWSQIAPKEYGFFANVNPKVDHPRWSQAKERRLPNSLLNPNIVATTPFNGYGEEVASLYAGMDLTRYF